MMQLEGKVAIVTGGASGIGEATVRVMAAQGASVVVTDINPKGATLAEDLGAKVIFQLHDVSSEEDWSRVVAAAEDNFGPVSILVNNAGIIAPGNNEGTIDNVDMDYFRKVLEVNQIGTFLGMRTVVDSMKRAGGGSIINLSSVGGLVGVPYTNAYSSTKWAVVGMTKCSALELGQFGIRVNSVHPGAIWTPIHYAGQSEEQQKNTRQLLDDATKNLPLPRVAEPVEVARMIAFLGSDAASYSTGSQFVVDGGWTAV